jgi:hypothetical protein
MTDGFFSILIFTYLAAVTKAQQASDSGLKSGKKWIYSSYGLLRGIPELVKPKLICTQVFPICRNPVVIRLDSTRPY